ncbi:MAG: hypothetical protein R3B93_07405 [Bacteroidia bacterium]
MLKERYQITNSGHLSTSYSRNASEDEMQAAKEFIQIQAESYELFPEEEITDHVMIWAELLSLHFFFNLKEFIHFDMKNKPISRREMLTLSRNGFGSIALLGLMSSLPFGNKISAIEAVTAKALLLPYSSLCPQSEKHHLLIHGWRRFPGG